MARAPIRTGPGARRGRWRGVPRRAASYRHPRPSPDRAPHAGGRPEGGTGAARRPVGEDDEMASLTPSDRQARRRDEVAVLLAAECPLPRVRAAEKLGFDADLWRALEGAGALADPDD